VLRWLETVDFCFCLLAAWLLFLPAGGFCVLAAWIDLAVGWIGPCFWLPAA
jgi:hypothetical protein